MSQNIISLGLDAASFSPEKEAQLNRFIVLFEKLSTFDGKNISPVLGSGLVEFNTNIAASGKLLDEINSKLAQFNANTVSTAKATTAATAAQTSSTSAQTQQATATNNVTKAQNANVSSTQQLTSEYKKLVDLQKQQFTAYSNLYISQGRNSQLTKSALSDYALTTQRINEIDKSATKASGSIAGIGRSLGSGLNQLRQLAYILPGIGLAGIFNVAIQAISRVIEELGFFTKEVERAAKSEIELNGILKDQISLFNTLLSVVKEVSAANQFNLVSLEQSSLNASKTAGLGKDLQLPIERKIAQDKFDEATTEMRAAFKSEENINRELDKRKNSLADTIRKLSDLNKQEAEINRTREEVRLRRAENNKSILDAFTPPSQEDIAKGLKDSRFLKSVPDESVRKAQRDALQSEVAIEQEKIKLLTGVSNNYFKLREELNIKDKEIFKFTADEENAIDKERYENRIKLAIEASDRTLRAEISSRDQKLGALNSIANSEKELSRKEFETTNNTLGLTTAQKLIAEENYRTKVIEIDKKLAVDRHKIIEDYRIQLLSAIEGIAKDSLEKEAIYNQKVFQNDQNGLDERLKAYKNYIIEKQKQQDLETKLQLEAERLRAGGVVPQKQRERIASAADLQKANIQANAEKQVYDIVYNSLSKQLKLIIDENSFEDKESRKQYTKELNDATDRYEAKKIRYIQYRREIKEIQHKYNVEGYDEAIVDDKKDLDRLENHLEDLKRAKKGADNEVDTAFIQNDINKTEGKDTLNSQKNYDIAVGQQEALAKSINDTDLEIKAKKEQLGKDEFERAKARIVQRKELEHELYAYIKQLGDEVFNLIQKRTDAEYQIKEDAVEKQKELIDENLENDINAVDKSSLSAKDKAALDIQLNAQKVQNDKNAAKEENKLKHDNAVADQKIAIAKIIWNTEEAISATYARFGFPVGIPLAIAQGVLGAIQVATVLATPVPSYSEGTLYHPGGKARVGEKGTEIIKEPYRSPYLVHREVITELPVGTKVIPIKDHPELGGSVMNNNDTWEQTKWLGRQIRKISNKTVNKNIINIDLGFETYKHKQLHG